REFWWDELEFIILLSKNLPSKLTLRLDKKEFTSDLSSEEYLSKSLREKHKQWKATIQPAPSKRCDLYLKLYEILQPLTNEEQLRHLKFLRKWAGIGDVARPEYFSIKEQELIELGKSNYINIGSHTVSHPTLAFQN